MEGLLNVLRTIRTAAIGVAAGGAPATNCSDASASAAAAAALERESSENGLIH